MAALHHQQHPRAQRRRTPSPINRPINSLMAGLLGGALASMAVVGGLAGAELIPPVRAQSNLLESVRRNPARAKALCGQLREMNKQGISYTSKKATRTIAAQEGLSAVDAEVLTTYVVGMHCPDVR